ncbi:RICIN domain-containing protein [Polaribacter sp.]|uniref:RICIN domain-containing protein n=1 Tax=Polaribacter sp. TaxID=1920175 RepID=UPI003EF0A613
MKTAVLLNYLKTNYSLIILTFLIFLQTNPINSQNLDNDYYYRLTTRWQGDSKSLDILNDSKKNKPILAKTGAYTGQYWKITPVGGGYYRLSNQWQGEYKSLDIVNDGKNNKPILVNTGNYTGQFWKITSVGGGYYRLTNKWQGATKSLDIINDSKKNTPILAKTGSYTGQYWKFTKLHKVVEDPGISMVFASDPQWAWTAKTDAGTTETEAEKEKEATTLNENHVKSMNSLISSLKNVKGVIINGDLTAYGHSKEFEPFKKIYAKLKAPMYLGLGNHDYGNNVDNTYENNSANRMVNYMVEHIKSNGATNSDYKVSSAYQFPNVETTTTGSLSYSWDIGNIHFVQLQNYPIYTRSWSNYVSIGAAKRRTVKITSSLNWLATDLAKARNSGKIIVLNFHDSDEHWGDYYDNTKLNSLSNEFKGLLSTYKVAAVFVGHYHSSLGKRTPPRRPSTYGTTPVFYCGSASQSKYLLVNFKGNKMSVEKVSSASGGATRTNKTEYTVFNSKESVAIPKQDGWVTFFNQAGYVAKYSLSYTLNGSTKSFSTGNIALGNKKRFTIPGKATNIKIKGEGKTGLLWEMWRTTFSKTYNSPPNKCFKSYGTTLNQKYNNNCD